MKNLTKVENNNTVANVEMFGDEIITGFIASRHVSSNTQRAYRNALTQLLKYFGSRRVIVPNEIDIDGFVEYLRDTGKSASTLRQYTAVTKLFFGFLERKGIFANIAEGVRLKLRKAVKHKKRSLSDKQAVDLLNAITGDNEKSLRDKCLVALSLCCGLRQIELSRANIGSIEILDSGRKILYVIGKGHAANGEDDAIVLPEAVWQILVAYLDCRGVNIGDNAPLFTVVSNRGRGNRLSVDAIGKIFRALIRNTLGIRDKKITAHSCRHYFATTCIRSGIDIREVSSALRHSSVTVTMIYLHDLDVATRQAENTVASKLFAAA